MWGLLVGLWVLVRGVDSLGHFCGILVGLGWWGCEGFWMGGEERGGLWRRNWGWGWWGVGGGGFEGRGRVLGGADGGDGGDLEVGKGVSGKVESVEEGM